MDEQDLDALIGRARAGDGAAMAVLRRFEGDIRGAVRARLPRALRAQFDSMDFVQAVWESFLGADDERVEGGFVDEGQLRGYLKGMARNKVLEEHRKRTKTRKYDLKREEPLYVRRGGRDVPRDVSAADPTPSQVAQAHDRLDQLTAGRSPEEAEAIVLRSQGLPFEEVARRTGMNERTVRRLVEGIRRHMEERSWR